MISLLSKIREECSDFITDCCGIPLVKAISCDGRFIKKVKVRKKNKKDGFIESFNTAFDDTYNNIHGRSIFCNGRHMAKTENSDRFYVFPINGYKYLFNENVEYHREYQEIYSKLLNIMTAEECERVFVDIIRYSYKESSIRLEDALLTQKEVIIYNVPYYYAVKADKFPDFFGLIQEMK